MGNLYLDPLVTEDILAEIFRHRSPGNYRKNVCKERKRGRSGGVRLRLKCQRLHRIPLPSIRLANVQSLRNKTDELQANSNYLHEYRNACIMAFSEMWLSSRDSDADLSRGCLSGLTGTPNLWGNLRVVVYAYTLTSGGAATSPSGNHYAQLTSNCYLSLFARSISQENSPRYLGL